MMELALIKTLLDRDFYEQHKGIRCPDKIFSKDVRKIKQALDSAMETYDGNMNVQDLQAVFNRMNQSMTTATRTAYDALFRRIDIAEPIKEEIAQDTLSHLFQQHVGDVENHLPSYHRQKLVQRKYSIHFLYSGLALFQSLIQVH